MAWWEWVAAVDVAIVLLVWGACIAAGRSDEHNGGK
jgi:hypothetical protein